MTKAKFQSDLVLGWGDPGDPAFRLRFEGLLADISARFITLPADQVDAEIRGALRAICEALGLQRAALYQTSRQEPGTFWLSHYYQSPEAPPLPPTTALNAREAFPWLSERIFAGEIVPISRMSDLPREADRDRETFRSVGTKATVAIPLLAPGGGILGAQTFASLREEREWPEEVVRRFRLVAEILASVLSRKAAEEARLESEENLSLATETAGVGLWAFDEASDACWAAPRTRELYDIDEGTLVTEESILQRVHPEDRGDFLRLQQEARETGEGSEGDVRLVRPDGSIRWIAVRERFHRHAPSDGGRLVGAAIDITARKRMERELRERLEEIEQLRRQLELDNLALREEIETITPHKSVVGRSEAMRSVLKKVERVAPTDSTVLVTGETGTGKGLIAQTIHEMSARRGRRMVTVNCAALPITLIEAELFGHEAGAYSGAVSKVLGRFEAADGSTLFLDEIGDLPLEAQTKLLRVLEEGTFERVGSPQSIRVDVRVLAATNRDLAQRVRDGRFRGDLFYRLNVFPIHIPPLRERPEDIAPLVQSFVLQLGKKMGKPVENVSGKSMAALTRNPWPGNARELRNVIERALILESGPTLHPSIPGADANDKPAPSENLDRVERDHILAILRRTGWNVRAAAETLGLKRTTLYERLKKLGIRRESS